MRNSIKKLGIFAAALTAVSLVAAAPALADEYTTVPPPVANLAQPVAYGYGGGYYGGGYYDNGYRYDRDGRWEHRRWERERERGWRGHEWREHEWREHEAREHMRRGW